MSEGNVGVRELFSRYDMEDRGLNQDEIAAEAAKVLSSLGGTEVCAVHCPTPRYAPKCMGMGVKGRLAFANFPSAGGIACCVKQDHGWAVFSVSSVVSIVAPSKDTLGVPSIIVCFPSHIPISEGYIAVQAAMFASLARKGVPE